MKTNLQVNQKTNKNEEAVNMRNLQELGVTYDEAIEEIVNEVSNEYLLRLLEDCYVRVEIDNAKYYTKGLPQTITSYELNQKINEHRKSTGLKNEQLYHNFLKTIRKNEEQFMELGVTFTKLKVDNHVRNIYILNKDAVGLLMNLIARDSDLVPLQEVYEGLGGEKRNVIIVNRPEDEFMKALQEVLEAMGTSVQREVYIDKYRVDGLLKDYNLVIEYDDDYHRYPAQIERDIDRENELQAKGYTVLRLDYRDSNATNIGLVMKEIIKIKQ